MRAGKLVADVALGVEEVAVYTVTWVRYAALSFAVRRAGEVGFRVGTMHGYDDEIAGRAQGGAWGDSNATPGTSVAGMPSLSFVTPAVAGAVG
ncbi:hypothetical protein CMUS01_01619 [Colletotrichum musicola]|uniref:Uncharacterized protein n=1 Tax=Colletotrichum musicola TaxID=2175873 RepID=A0A8H6NWM4_9PEZI|nr:hypothetical protein CMUS01_01619 [Colletotrichum musicola]